MSAAPPRWPLAEIKVLDLGQIYNGAYASFLLAHAGADVDPGGPRLRDHLFHRGDDSWVLDVAQHAEGAGQVVGADD